MIFINEAARFYIRTLYEDAKISKLYGKSDAGSYVPDYAKWAALSISKGDLTLAKAVLAARDALQRRQQGAVLVRMLIPYESALGASVASLTGSDDKDAQEQTVQFVYDLSDEERGLAPTYISGLTHLCRQLGELWTREPKFRQVLHQALGETFAEIREKGTDHLVTGGILAYGSAHPPTSIGLRARTITPAKLSWDDELIMILSGQRPGVAEHDAFIAIDVAAYAQSVVDCPAQTVFAPAHVLDVMRSHADGQAYVQEVVARYFKEHLTQVRTATRNQVALALDKDPTTLAVTRRAWVLDALSAGVQAPDRRGVALDRSTGYDLKPLWREYEGWRVYHRYNVLTAEVTPVTNDRLPSIDEFVTKPRRIRDVPVYTIEQLTEYVAVTKQDAADKLAALQRLAAVVGSDRALFDAFFEQRTAEAKRREGVRVRLRLRFTPEQDALLARLWQPYMTKEVKAQLEAACPEHTWNRVRLRGELLAALARNKAPLTFADDVEALKKVLLTYELGRFRHVIGGDERVIPV